MECIVSYKKRKIYDKRFVYKNKKYMVLLLNSVVYLPKISIGALTLLIFILLPMCYAVEEILKKNKLPNKNM